MIPSSPVAFWHYFDVITFIASAIIVTRLIWAHYKKTGGLLSSVSQTVAYSQASSIVFSITMTTFFPLYNSYLWFWVLPLVSAPHWLYIILIASSICEIVVAWVPAAPGESKKIHGLSAGIVGIFMWLLALSLLALGKDLPAVTRISLVVLLLTPAVFGLAMLNQRLRKHTFLYETAYCGIFLATMSIVGHL